MGTVRGGRSSLTESACCIIGVVPWLDLGRGRGGRRAACDLSLRVRMIAILALVVPVYAILAWVAQERVVYAQFQAIEEASAARNMERCLEAIAAESRHLDKLCTDWARWDDTYDFVLDANEEYIEENLTPETFEGMNLTWLFILGADDKVVWGASVVPETYEPFPIPGMPGTPECPAALRYEKTVEEPTVGVLMTESGPMVVAARPILTSGGEGPSRGTLVMGRLLEDGEMAAIAQQTRVDVRQLAGRTEPPFDKPGLTRVVDGQGTVEIVRLEPNRLVVEGKLADVTGARALVLEAVTPRTTTNAGRAALRLSALFLVAIGLLTALVILGAMERAVLVRVRRLRSEIATLAEHRDFAGRVSISGRDELSSLAIQMNAMLAELGEAHDALRVSEGLMQAVFRNAAVGAAVLDIEGRYLQVNERWAQMLGRSRDDLVGHRCHEITHPEDVEEYCDLVYGTLGCTLEVHRAEIRCLRSDGEAIWVDVSASLIRGDDNQPSAVVSIYADITDRRRAERELQAISKRDPLTGLANRRAFDEQFEAEWRRALRTGRPVSMLMLDVDHFKRYNDAYGHVQGDECLQELAAVLKDVFRRAVDFPSRWGGEEFAVVLSDADEDEALRAAERIRAAVERRALPRPGDEPDVVTVSVGFATARPSAGDDRNELLAAADKGLYAAKGAGRNCVRGAE